MGQPSILSDELLRHLIAAGQADIVVGVPSYNNAATIGPVIQAVHVAFARHFHRHRALLINTDGGSEDGTPDVVRSASLGESESIVASQALRTIHRISAPYHGLPGKGGALRVLFTAAELLQAKAVAVVDADVTSITPEWIERLVRPILQDGLDYVAPAYARHRLEGPLVTQLVRPLVRSCYARRLREPVGGELGCSGRFAAHCLRQDVWEREFMRDAGDLWIAATALAGDFRCGQAFLGSRVVAPSQARPALPVVFRQVVGTLFACLGLHDAAWLPRNGSEEIPTTGAPETPAGEEPVLDPAPMAELFRTGVHELAPILEQILPADLLQRLRGAAEAAQPVPSFPDELWALTVYEFAAAHRRAMMMPEHVTQALVPLYLGRVASFAGEHAHSPAPQVEERLEALALAYERSRPYLVDRWNSVPRR